MLSLLLALVIGLALPVASAPICLCLATPTQTAHHHDHSCCAPRPIAKVAALPECCRDHTTNAQAVGDADDDNPDHSAALAVVPVTLDLAPSEEAATLPPTRGESPPVTFAPLALRI